MTQAPTGRARLLAIAWWGAHSLGAAACAHRPAPAPAAPAAPAAAAAAAPATPAPESRAPVILHVTNSNWSDVRIYVVRGSIWVRLGMVTTNSTAEFAIPPDFLREAGSATLVASPIAGRGSYAAPLTGVLPGDVVELTVENYLQYSHVVVR